MASSKASKFAGSARDVSDGDDSDATTGRSNTRPSRRRKRPALTSRDGGSSVTDSPASSNHQQDPTLANIQDEQINAVGTSLPNSNSDRTNNDNNSSIRPRRTPNSPLTGLSSSTFETPNQARDRIGGRLPVSNGNSASSSVPVSRGSGHIGAHIDSEPASRLSSLHRQQRSNPQQQHHHEHQEPDQHQHQQQQQLEQFHHEHVAQPSHQLQHRQDRQQAQQPLQEQAQQQSSNPTSSSSLQSALSSRSTATQHNLRSMRNAETRGNTVRRPSAQNRAQTQVTVQSTTNGDSNQGNETNSAHPSAVISTISTPSTNMSPPRPTRALPRRHASARTLNRPVLSSTNTASSSYALRSRSTSNSTVLSSASSNANILASGQSHYNRQNVPTGCGPFNGGFDPASNPPSGLSTPRTPLAEIPLWLADMRSESRRSSASSSSILERDDWLASLHSSARHSRTASISSSGPPSPGTTRNGSTSPILPFRRSMRGRREPRQSDENARYSPTPSYFGEYDLSSQLSSSSALTEASSFDEQTDPNRGLSSRMTNLGTSSTLTASSSAANQTSSPAMSTRSRTLNRTTSTRTRRLTESMNTPVAVDSFPPSSSESALNTPRFLDGQMPLSEHGGRPSLIERRTAAANPSIAARAGSRTHSRTSSPGRATRSSTRRRSIMFETSADPSPEQVFFGPQPRSLAPLLIPGNMLETPSGSSPRQESTSDHWSGMQPGSQGSSTSPFEEGGLPMMQLEPVSPSAYSEMTTLTQSSLAAESTTSSGGMPRTPSSSVSPFEHFPAPPLPHGDRESQHRHRHARSVNAASAAAALPDGSHSLADRIVDPFDSKLDGENEVPSDLDALGLHFHGHA